MYPHCPNQLTIAKIRIAKHLDTDDGNALVSPGDQHRRKSHILEKVFQVKKNVKVREFKYFETRIPIVNAPG